GMMGGAWNAEGVILFGGRHGLHRVAATGGRPTTVIPISQGRKENGFGFPQFLPDGNRFLFFIRSDDRSVQGVYLASMDHAEERRLGVASERKALYVPDVGDQTGYLLSLRDQTLVAQPVSPGNFENVGDQLTIAEQVALTPNLFDASFWASDS